MKDKIAGLGFYFSIFSVQLWIGKNVASSRLSWSNLRCSLSVNIFHRSISNHCNHLYQSYRYCRFVFTLTWKEGIFFNSLLTDWRYFGLERFEIFLETLLLTNTHQVEMASNDRQLFNRRRRFIGDKIKLQFEF